MLDRLTLEIKRDGELRLEGEALSFEQLKQRLENDQQQGLTSMIVGNAAEEPSWDILEPVLKLLQQYGRTPVGIVGSDVKHG